MAIYIANTKNWREKFHFIPPNGRFVYGRNLHNLKTTTHIMFSAAIFHILTVKFSNKLKQNYNTLETTKLSVFLVSHFLANRNTKLER